LGLQAQQVKILIVIANYYPVHNPNVFRWAAIAEYWSHQGKEVHVLTTKHGACPLAEEMNGVQVHRTGHASLKDLHAAWTGKSNDRNIPNSAEADQAKSNQINTTSEKLVDLTWRKFYWPDGAMPFISPGIKRSKELMEHHVFDRVYSVGLPFSCHIIARRLKGLNPNLNWHMDIEDPFCYSKEFFVNNHKLYRTKNIKEEERAFQMADSISVTNENAKLEYRPYFHEELHKVSIIPPLHLPTDQSPQEVFDPGKTHFGYFGAFYKDVRSPENFLAFLSYIKANHQAWLEDKQFHFYGQANRFSAPIFKSYWELDKYVQIHGMVDRDQSIALMNQMDVLINFGNTTSYHLPSKSVDYLSTSKPILNIKEHPNDSFELFANNYDACFHINLQKDKSEQQFENLNNFLDAQELRSKTNSAVAESRKNSFDMQPYLIDQISKSYLNPTS